MERQKPEEEFSTWGPALQAAVSCARAVSLRALVHVLQAGVKVRNPWPSHHFLGSTFLRALGIYYPGCSFLSSKQGEGKDKLFAFVLTLQET